MFYLKKKSLLKKYESNLTDKKVGRGWNWKKN